MKGHWWLWMMLTAGLMTGCSADEPIAGGGVPIVHPDVTPTAVTEPEIIFHVSDEWQQMTNTRATIYAAGALTSGSFKVFAYNAGTTTEYIGGSTVNYVTGAWSFADGKHYWPATGYLDFFAYMPATKPAYIGDITYSVSDEDGNSVADGPSFVCSNLPVTSSEQAEVNEFIYAYATNQVKGVDVPLCYVHPFATIYVRLKTSHDAVYQMNSITFKGIMNNGIFTYGKSTQWSASGEATDLVLSIVQQEEQPTKTVVADADFTDDQLTALHTPFLVMPQNLTNADQIEVSLVWNEGGATTILVYDNPVTSWVAGNSYTYTIDLSNPKSTR